MFLSLSSKPAVLPRENLIFSILFSNKSGSWIYEIPTSFVAESLHTLGCEVACVKSSEQLD